MRGSREEYEERDSWGFKTFHNKTGWALNLTLYVRSGDNPANNAGTKDVHLQPNQSLGVRYGDHIDRYLNGFSLVVSKNGDIVSRQEFIIQRGSGLDKRLNENNNVEIVYTNGIFDIRSYNG